jgi:hypothetical protein
MKRTRHREVLSTLNAGLLAHPAQVALAGFTADDTRKLRNKMKALRKRWRKS